MTGGRKPTTTPAHTTAGTRQNGAPKMPGLFIEAPAGVQPDAKQEMMREITAAIREAYRIQDIRIWLREYPPGNVAMDGHINAEPVKPVCFLEAPELASLEAKSQYH
jgi:hypothetical protein